MDTEITFTVRTTGRLTLPGGEYRHWYSDKSGYFFANDESEFVLVSRRGFGREKTERFKGGLWLSRRSRTVMVYQWFTTLDEARQVGEAVPLAPGALDKPGGPFGVFRGEVPWEVAAHLGRVP